MHKNQKKFINRIITKIYIVTKNDTIRLRLMNWCTKLFVDFKNKIEYDQINKIFWLKYDNEYLLPVENPYFDFHKTRFEERALNIFCQHYVPGKGDIIIDIGAGVGDEIAFFSKSISNEGKLFAIEASPASFKKLVLLSEKNFFRNCYNFNLAIAGNNGEIWIEETDDYLKNSINKSSRGLKVPCYTLDQFVADNKIQKVNLLKVNIEGAEYEMIDGMENSIKIIENLAISCHDFLSPDLNNKIRNKLVTFLNSNNFVIYTRNTGNRILDSWIYGKRKN